MADAFNWAWGIVKDSKCPECGYPMDSAKCNHVRCGCGNMESPNCRLEGSNCDDASCSGCCNCPE